MCPRTIFLTTPGFEPALLGELGGGFRVESAARGIVVGTEPLGHLHATPGMGAPSTADAASRSDLPVLVSPVAAPFEDPVFARQTLPLASEIRAPSVSKMADALYDSIESSIDGLAAEPGARSDSAAFTVHVMAPPGDGGLGSRVDLIGRELCSRLRERRRRAWRRFLVPEAASQRFEHIALLIQLLLPERDRVFLSMVCPRPLAHGGWDVAPWPAGIAPVADDRAPPTRAYRKLEEAFSWMADQPRTGEMCVDLGAAPGGWTYTALKRGAHVIAVDRASVDASLRGHPNLRMIEGNAFSFAPDGNRQADWLLSDVICQPERSLALVDRWLDMAWCRKLVVTIKFKGDSGYGLLPRLRESLLRAGCPRLRIKHLHHNKNEVTVMASAPSRVPRAGPGSQ